MFERFTDRARRVIVLSEQEARAFPHDRVHPAHTLLGLITEGEGVAAQVLAGLGVTAAAVRAELLLISPPADRTPGGHIPFDPRNKKLIETALREALNLGHNYIGTEHILLAVASLSDDTAAHILHKLGHSSLEVRAAVLEKLGGYEDKGRHVRPAPVAPPAERYAPPSEVLAAARAVAERLADLDGYIERRARELAAPAIAETERARESAQVRIPDLQREYGRQIAALERQVASARAECDRLQREADKEIRSA